MIINKIRNVIRTIKNKNQNSEELLKITRDMLFLLKSDFKIIEQKIEEIKHQLIQNETQLKQNETQLEGIKDREIETVKALCFQVLAKLERTAQTVVKTDYKIAYDSPDYIVPWGTKNDNSKYYEFNSKLYQLLGLNKIKLLDIGCAGGGFVQSIIEDGSFAIGLEGSDYSKLINRAAWRIIPNNLFTCDVTKPFSVYDSTNNQIQFDAITAWELMEHIKEEDIPVLLENIKKHLNDNGMFICSVSTVDDYDSASGIHWHQTVKPKEWWLNVLYENGFIEIKQEIIKKGDWLRGSGHANMDWTEDQNMGFHMVLKKDI